MRSQQQQPAECTSSGCTLPLALKFFGMQDVTAGAVSAAVHEMASDCPSLQIPQDLRWMAEPALNLDLRSDRHPVV